MESKKLRTDDHEIVNTRKVIVLSSSSSSSASASTTIISTSTSSSSSSGSISTIIQPDFDEEEGEYIEHNSLGNKRKYSISSDTSSSRGINNTRVVSDNRGAAQVTVSEYNKPRPPKDKREGRNRDNRDNELSKRKNRGVLREKGLKRSDMKIISLFSALASNDHKIKLSAIKSLPPISPYHPQILKIVKSEISKTSSPIDFRLAALDLLNEMILLDQLKNMVIPEVTVLLLKLAYEDNAEGIKCKALTTLGTLLETKSIDWMRVRNLIKFAVPKGTITDDPYDLFTVLPRELNPSEAIFAILSHVAANDIHRTVRLTAMELLSKIPAAFVGVSILYQSTKKDRQKEGAGMSKAMKKKLQSKGKETSLSLPLLCCGVFAHGIEDQFVKIRFAALNSLFALLNSVPEDIKKDSFIDKGVLWIFLDSLLDECDLIRLAALKFIGQLGELDLTIQSGLESLLAVLDDQNEEIRCEALKIIGNNLILSETGDPNSSRSATNNETVLRTQRCIEAAILKYPEMEFSGMEAMIKFMYRVKETVQRSCNELLCHLMQSQIPKYMLPSSLLPTYTSGSLSNVHLIMQIPFMENERMEQARLVKIISRISSVDDGEKLKFLRSIKLVPANLNQEPNFSYKNEQVKLFKLLVTRHGHLESKYEAEKHEKLPFFFLNDSKPPNPVAYLRINSVRIDEHRHRILIDDYKLLGSIEEVKIALMTVEALVPFELRYGKVFVAPMDNKEMGGSFKIINLSNNEIMYKSSK